MIRKFFCFRLFTLNKRILNDLKNISVNCKTKSESILQLYDHKFIKLYWIPNTLQTITINGLEIHSKEKCLYFNLLIYKNPCL